MITKNKTTNIFSKSKLLLLSLLAVPAILSFSLISCGSEKDKVVPFTSEYFNLDNQNLSGFSADVMANNAKISKFNTLLIGDVTSIDADAFSEKIPSNIKKIIFSKDCKITTIEEDSFSNNTSIKTVILSNSVVEINDNAFQNCTSLKKLVLDDNLEYIGDSTFSNCSSMLGDNSSSFLLPLSLTYIGNNAFSNCSSLVNLDIPDYVTTIGTEAFSNCQSLFNVSVDHIYSFPTRCFFNCTSLLSISFAEATTFIGESAFEGCYSLSPYFNSFSNDSLSIGKKAFSNTLHSATDGTTLNLPKNISSIGENAFASTGIQSVYVSWTATNQVSINATAFADVMIGGIVYGINNDVPSTVKQMVVAAINNSWTYQ